MRLPVRHHPRPGLSLLEVLVALGIFLFALVALGQLVNLGSDRAVEVRQQQRALQRCQSKMAEVIAGAVSLSSSSSDVPFDDDPDWRWSMTDNQSTSVTGLWSVTVTVNHQRSDGTQIQCSLSQMVLDPSLRGGTGATSSPSPTAAGAAGTAMGGG